MRDRKIYYHQVRIVLFSLILFACASIVSTPISKITENPRDFTGRTVKISGEVTETFGFFVVKYFVLRDETGDITVITEQPLPKKGSHITVKGKVEEAFSLGETQLIVIIEEKN